MSLKRRLIFTADDFGLSEPVNEAVERAHIGGILQSASLMVGAPATTDAVARARLLPSLRVGLHVVLVNGTPVLPPERVPDLVDARGAFPSDLLAAGIRYFANRAARRQMRDEIRAQFERFAATGLALDHVNAQNHLHVHPTIFRTVLEIGKDFGLRAVRIPREPFRPSWRSAGTRFGKRLAKAMLLAPWFALMTLRARRAGLACNDYLFGMNDTGEMTSELVRRIVGALPVGISELVFHPATAPWPGSDAVMPGYRFTEELDALMDRGVADAVRTSGAVRTSFTELARERAA